MGARVATSAGQRRRVWLIIGAVTLAFLALRGFVAWSDWRDRDSSTSTPASSGLPTRTVEAGAVTVKLEPRQMDASGAVFKISFDTHSVDLGFDVARQARLVVDGVTWPVAGWSGSGPGGHHRDGELRFTASGPASGTATLTISALPKPVRASWTLG
jgi:hypothetical protein